ncbi:TatD family hydrolase [Glaciecola sp. MH2013]|nr:TatD family hydrolase [Glaciecola sp. MH2013]
MPLIDSHCHLDLAAFDHDRAQVLKDAADHGIKGILIPGLDNKQFNKLLDLQTRISTPELFIDIALGIHPYFMQAALQEGSDKLRGDFCELAESYQHKIVAIGECGLDSVLMLDMPIQARILQMQIEVAKQLNKPLVLHHRQSHNQLIRLLKKTKFQGGGLIHAFSGSVELAKTYIDLGFYLGVGGTITYPRAQKTRNALASISLQHLLLETDAPDMPLNGFQGQRNSPVQLPRVADALAQLKACTIQEVATVTCRNYSLLFSR